MSKLYLAKIDVKKIIKEKLFKGEKGTYLDLFIWVNDEEDQYGNILSIQQATKMGEDKIYLGNGKEHIKAEPEKPKTNDLAAIGQEEDDMPF